VKLLLSILFASVLAAQTTPHAGYVFPAGARQGMTLDVRVGGQFLNSVTKAYVSGKGVLVVSVEYTKPINGKEMQFMREEQQKLFEKRGAANRGGRNGTERVVFTEQEQKRLDEIRDLMEMWQRRQFVPSLGEHVTVRLAISPDAPVGPREVRLEGNNGLTNPIIFCVGDLPEYARKPGRVGVAYNVVNGGIPLIRNNAKEPDPPTDVTLPVVVNGQMMPGANDLFRFQAKKGQHIVVAAAARELMPYVSDAVPGWFQAAISLRDSKGKVLASADHFLFHPDPLLHYEIPSDGEYIAEIHDSIYRGREDFIYRLTIGELPVITSIFPLGGKAGARTAIEAHGWNLPTGKLVQDFTRETAGVRAVSVRKDGVASNAFAFALDTLPEVAAKPGIGRREKAQRVKLPVIVNGRFAQPGDEAFFRIDANAGQEMVAEVIARRLGSPVDSVLRLTDAKGKEVAFNDDFEDRGAALITHQSDSFISFKFPVKGIYYLQLSDAQHKGGPEYGYRLRISQPRPEFELRVTPSSFNVRAGQTIPFIVYALRRDGFNGEIQLKLKDAPANFILSGAAIPEGQDHVRLTLTIPKTPGAEPLSIQMTGKAMVAGRETTRTAVPAEDMQQAFAYHHIVPEDAWLVRVIGNGQGGNNLRALDKPVALKAGADTNFDVFLPYRGQTGVQVALNDPPEGIAIRKVTPSREGLSVLVSVQADKAKPGLKGNLILDAYRDVAANPAAGIRQGRRQPMGTLPAVPFEVVAK
jgi:hypothetical protein